MSSSNNCSNKRVRRDTNSMQLQLSDLPEGLLPKIASYLPCTSCVSFAMSMTQRSLFSSHQPSIMSKTIANASVESWKSLDFKDIQDICGCNLTDSDIRWVLLAIDGVNKIKSLKFTNCLGIMGSGLQPLTWSTVLERIDLSLVGDHQNPTITPESPISAELVVPILNSIVEREDNVLVHVQLPKKWRIERSNVLTQFLQRFDRLLNSRRYSCSGCADGEICKRYENEYELVYWGQDWLHNEVNVETYGTVSLGCYLCEKNFCGICEYNCEFSFCKTCEKYYCQECNDVNYCQGADCPSPHQPSSCPACGIVKGCDECGMGYCQDCEPTFVDACQYCDKKYCGDFSQYMYICQGEGCNRANCNKGECFDDNKESVKCVWMYKGHRGDEEHDLFCVDCYEKACARAKAAMATF